MPRIELPDVAGVMSAAQVAQTVDAIAANQLPDGNIPWTPGGHTDPWNLVEAAMALDVGGRHAESRRAFEWLRRRQRPDIGFLPAFAIVAPMSRPEPRSWQACPPIPRRQRQSSIN